MPKLVLPPNKIVSAQSMASNVTSKTVAIQMFDNVGVQLNFTGTPTGTFAINVSQDQTNWSPLTLSPSPAASGAAGSIYIDLNQISAAYLQVVYTASSGTGSLDVFVAGKAV